jgi:hypothetical protein
MLSSTKNRATKFFVIIAFAAINMFPTPSAVSADNFDELCTVVGTELDDVLIGTSADDVICGLGGNDTISGGDGTDVIVGGPGADIINGGNGNDRLSGGDGDDQIFGDEGLDYAEGGPGADRLFGGNGIDALIGGTENDTLVGGASSDSLDGGDGIDYCDKDKNDSSTSSCFFDKSGPKLISIAISTKSIDTSINSAVMIFRVRALDKGTGVKTVGFSFAPKDNLNSEWGFSSNAGGYDCGIGLLPPDPDTKNLVTGCRVSGDNFDGVYEVRFLVPRQTPKGKYALQHIQLVDNAGNTIEMQSPELIAKKLAVTFRQVGAGDITKPKIVFFKMLTKSVNTDNNSAIINFVVRVKDVGAGVNTVSVTFSGRKIGSFGGGSGFDPNVVLPCNGTNAPDPMPEQSSSSCLSSGTEFDGTVNVKIRLPQYSPKGVYRLDSILVDDKVMNTTQIINKSPWNKIGFAQTGAGDSKPPKISKITVLTPNLNTSTSDQIARLRVEFTDNLSGVTRASFFFSNLNRSNYFFFQFDALMQQCYQESNISSPSGSCLVSGTLQSGVIEFYSRLPAHAPINTFYLFDGGIDDKARNGIGCSRENYLECPFPIRKFQIKNAN